MVNDRVNALYRAQIFEEHTQEVCRARIHWLCSQAQGEQVLDLGCSEGIASLLLGQEGHQVVGVDINPAVLEVARNELNALPESLRQNIRFELVGTGRLPFDDASFDSVLMGEILEHQTQPERLLAEARRVLRPNGVVVVTTPFGVLRDEDHRRTFYLGDFLELMARFFHVDDVHILDKYICCKASVPGDAGEMGNGVVQPQRLLQLSEKAFQQVEDTYLKRIDRVRGELTTLKQRLEKLQAASETQRNERATLAAKLRTAEHWHSGALQFMQQLRGLVAPNGTEGTRSNLAARADRILSTADRYPDAAHALEMLGDVLRDLVASLDAQLVTQEQELARLRETHASELRAQAEQAQRERDAAVEVVRHESATAQQQHAAEEQRLKAARQKELDTLRQTLSEKQTRLSRQTEMLNYFRAQLDLKAHEVRYKLGDAFVRALKHPRDFVLLPVRLVSLFFEGLRRTRERRRLAMEPERRAVAAPLAAPPTVKPAPAVPPQPAAAPSAAAGAPKLTAPKPPSKSAPSPHKAEPKLQFRTVTAPNRAPRLTVKVAAIMDEFTQACFQPECQLMLVKPDDWKQVLTAERPDFLLVESAWSGNGGAWRYQVAVPRKIQEGPLLGLVQWCQSQKIPTVFWNKEDPPNFEQFINAAALFDHVFTTDENCIPAYQQRLGHARVYALPFAAQEAIHNPVDTHRKLAGNVCFAGAYYAQRHEERQADMDLLLKPALKRGLTIFDRMADFKDNERYSFPPEYRAAIRGALPYAEMLDAYKRYRVFLNVNSVKDSPTMFSRRVFELLACGTPVISTAALGIERLLGPECVGLVKTAEEAQQWLDLLLNNDDFADRMVLRAQRRIFSEHTYQQRLRTILQTIGVAVPASARRVSVITCTNRPGKLENVLANYERQKWPDKELVLVLNSDDFSLATVQERLATVPNARVLQLPAERTLGTCLNAALDEIRYEYWTKFDDDNHYAEHFIPDMLMPFLYTEASIVGKYSYYSYHEGPRCLALRHPGCEHQFVTLLSGSALIVDRKVNKEARFPDLNRGEDTQFLRECVHLGFKLYSSDRFNYVVRRSKRVQDHTWQITDAEFLRHCQIVAYTDDFRAHVEV